MASVIAAREFKLLLKPGLFPTKRTVLDFNKQLAKLATDFQVQYEGFERIDSQVREVQFYDTKDSVFRRNHLILRLRRDRSSGWPEETWEVTFKRRSPDFNESAQFDVNTSIANLDTRFKFKEEIIRGETAGSMSSIFSNNLVGYYPVMKFEQPMSRIIEVFPGLKALDLDPSAMVSPVNNARVFEIGARLGSYDFGKDVVAHADLAVWTRPTEDAFSVLVAEFGWSYHIKGEKHPEAHAKADTLFKALQEPLKDGLFDGTTKTALIYGYPES